MASKGIVYQVRSSLYIALTNKSNALTIFVSCGISKLAFNRSPPPLNRLWKITRGSGPHPPPNLFVLWAIANSCCIELESPHVQALLHWDPSFKWLDSTWDLHFIPSHDSFPVAVNSQTDYFGSPTPNFVFVFIYNTAHSCTKKNAVSIPPLQKAANWQCFFSPQSFSRISWSDSLSQGRFSQPAKIHFWSLSATHPCTEDAWAQKWPREKN